MVSRDTSISPRVSERAALVCASAMTLLAGFALLGWATSWRRLASIDLASIPMAPSTALVFLILAGALALEARRRSARLVITVSLLVLTVACVQLVTFLAGLPPTLDAMVVPAPAMFRGVPTGRMSPLTAFGLLFASVSLLLTGLAGRRRALAATVASLGLGVCLLGAVVTLGYFFDAPILYGGAVVPTAFSTGLAMVSLGLALVGLAPNYAAPLQAFTGSSARAQLLRAFLPIAPVIVVVELLFDQVKGMSPTVDAAATSLVSAVIAAGVVSYTARGVSRDLDRSRRDADRLAAIVQSSSDAIYAKNLDGTIVAWNASAEQLFGYAQDEVLGRSAMILLRPEAQSELAEIIAKIRAGERIDHQETDRVCKDGSRVHVSLSESPLRGANGQVEGISVIARDVSGKRRAEAALRESEGRFRRLVEHIREIVFAGGLEGPTMAHRLTFVSPQIEAVTGRPPQDFLADSGLWERLLHPDDIANVTMETERAVARDESVVRFYRLRNERTGEYRWIEDTFVPDHGDDGALRGFFVTARDITERWSIEAEAERLRRRSELLLTCAGEGIYGLAPDGTVTFINPKGASLLGYGVDELLGAPMHARCHHTHADGQRFPREECPIYAALTDGEIHTVDDDVMWRKDGSAVPIEYVSTPIRDEGGRVAGAVVVFRDISDRRRLEGAIRQSHKLEAIGRLAGGVAHDFNNILGVITGYGELMRRQIEASHPARPRLEEILKAAQRAAGLTHQLLAFSRKQVIQPRILDLRELVAELDKMLHRVIGEDVELQVREAPNLGAVKADPAQLEQMILNLAGNARDAMPKGGRLTIETANTDFDETYAAAHPPALAGRFVMLSVSDTGIGMDAETQRRIFEPFFTTKPMEEGSGLGLATVYGVVKQNGGYVSVDSEAGRGTTFKVYLPRVDEKPQARGGDTPLDLAPRGTETILLVEDTESLREMLREVLEDQGYTLLQASHGEEALALSRAYQGPIHLLLTDLVMPRLGGADLARQLASPRPEMRVIYMSACTDGAVSRPEELQEGSVLLEKPFTTDRLTRSVRQALGAPRGGAALRATPPAA